VVSAHSLEDCRQTVSEKALGRKHFSVLCLENKPLFAVANVIRKYIGKGGVKVDVSAGGIRL
jgi:hypothetical protein